MSENVKLVAENRTLKGKKVKRLRRQGLVPAVMYGQRDPISLQLDTLTTFLTLRDADDNALIDLEVGGAVYKVLVRDVQRHITRGDLLHVDFLEVNMDQIISTEATLVLVGAHQVDAAIPGNTTQLLYSVQIEGKPQDLVSEIEIDLGKIQDPNDVLTVNDLSTPAGITILTEFDVAVAKFDVERGSSEDDDEEGAEVATEAEETMAGDDIA